MTGVPTSVVLAHTDALREELERLGGVLTDDEISWEPVDGCWTVRKQPDGSLRQDWSPSPPVAPFTTIAWRLSHIGQSLGTHARRLFDHGSFNFSDHVATADVRGTIAFVRSSFESWRAGIAACGETMEENLALEVLLFNGHHRTHLAEIDTVRDLYRTSRDLDPEPFIDACLRGDQERVTRFASDDHHLVQRLSKDRDLVLLVSMMARWHLVPTLLELGCPVEARGAVGATALHYAAAFGPVDVVRLLVEHGADVDRKDLDYDSTPLGWAEFFGSRESTDYLA